MLVLESDWSEQRGAFLSKELIAGIRSGHSHSLGWHNSAIYLLRWSNASFFFQVYASTTAAVRKQEK